MKEPRPRIFSFLLMSSAVPDFVALSTTEWVSDPLLAFELGCELSVYRWSALDLLVAAQPSASADREELIDCLIEWFETSNGALLIDDIADYLYECLKDNFHCLLEDNSEYELSTILLRCWQDCVEKKNFQGILKMIGESSEWRKKMENAKKMAESQQREIENQQRKQEENEEAGEAGEGQEDEEEEEGENSSAALPASSVSSSVSPMDISDHIVPTLVSPAEDGWTVVEKKGKGRK